jgi:hypothetical protein
MLTSQTSYDSGNARLFEKQKRDAIGIVDL